MKARFGLAALLLSALFWAPGGPAAQLAGTRLAPLQAPLLQPASMTVASDAPIVVPTAASLNDRGWTGSSAIAPTQDITGDVLAAYTLAVAVSPTECHLTTPVLAAIGQVESGNLAGHTIGADHRVSPEILGPVLDGKNYRAVKDTDAGHWDHNTLWDRALGPMQIIPASWRVVGLDMDGDGVRDPQNVYDSAGAAMDYLCAGGRDLSTSAGLKQAILSYNESDSYLHAVLAWKSVFESADLDGSGAVPFVAALAVPLDDAAVQVTAAARPAAAPSPTTATAAETVTSSTPITKPGAPAATPTAPTSPTSPAAPATPPAATPASPATSPAAAPSAPATSTPDPAAADPAPADPAPADPAPADPPPADPAPSDPTPLPTCPVPVDPDVTTADQAAQDQPVVSPQTCTAPDGYRFDPDTGLLVPVPATTP
jgi:hypothetical protein